MLSGRQDELLCLRLLGTSGHTPHSVSESLQSISCVSSCYSSVTVVALGGGREEIS